LLGSSNELGSGSSESALEFAGGGSLERLDSRELDIDL